MTLKYGMLCDFTCALCRGEFCMDRPDAEAQAEARRDFPAFEQKDMVLVCVDCYEIMKAHGVLSTPRTNEPTRMD